ncbi:hypothetical protein KP509_22G073100 [Ceratopteris richardii]|uniref:Uncharacterized protein n=1 Tax=Ceratopteris richardii TaxID=49495 RepID=A0A8T2S7H3_CERRI|nr:hypothetical protein KP509_22G073100 [Ceratopteris richardii]
MNESPSISRDVRLPSFVVMRQQTSRSCSRIALKVVAYESVSCLLSVVAYDSVLISISVTRRRLRRLVKANLSVDFLLQRIRQFSSVSRRLRYCVDLHFCQSSSPGIRFAA